MIRATAIAIKYSEELERHLDNIPHDKSENECPDYKCKAIWIEKENFDISLLQHNPTFIKNFVCFTDTGSEELAIHNNDYKNYILSDLYLQPTDKYQPEQPIP